ncbi:MAG: peptidylprolyl isomerase [Saprospiraceae bacterium]|nr:peptidylprolyl isomerase [Saprospiraceae bacterium]
MYKFYCLGILLSLLLWSCGSETQAPRPRVKITTDYGSMILELYNETPLHRDNFLGLAKAGFYNNLMFHRANKNGFIQGGDPDSRGKVQENAILGYGDQDSTRIPAEFNTNFIMKRGALCGFHMGGKSNPNLSSTGTQFMIIHGHPIQPQQLKTVEAMRKKTYSKTQKDTYLRMGGMPKLDGKYTVFGEIVEGFEVLDSLVNQPTNSRLRPNKDIRMSVEVLQ